MCKLRGGGDWSPPVLEIMKFSGKRLVIWATALRETFQTLKIKFLVIYFDDGSPTCMYINSVLKFRCRNLVVLTLLLFKDIVGLNKVVLEGRS